MLLLLTATYLIDNNFMLNVLFQKEALFSNVCTEFCRMKPYNLSLYAQHRRETAIISVSVAESHTCL